MQAHAIGECPMEEVSAVCLPSNKVALYHGIYASNLISLSEDSCTTPGPRAMVVVYTIEGLDGDDINQVSITGPNELKLPEHAVRNIETVRASAHFCSMYHGCMRVLIPLPPQSKDNKVICHMHAGFGTVDLRSGAWRECKGETWGLIAHQDVILTCDTTAKKLMIYDQETLQLLASHPLDVHTFGIVAFGNTVMLKGRDSIRMLKFSRCGRKIQWTELASRNELFYIAKPGVWNRLIHMDARYLLWQHKGMMVVTDMKTLENLRTFGLSVDERVPHVHLCGGRLLYGDHNKARCTVKVW